MAATFKQSMALFKRIPDWADYVGDTKRSDQRVDRLSLELLNYFDVRTLKATNDKGALAKAIEEFGRANFVLIVMKSK